MGRVYGILVHADRAGYTGAPGKGTLNYIRQPGTTSYNDLIDRDGTWAQLMDPWLAAWAHGYMNPTYHSLAFAARVRAMLP